MITEKDLAAGKEHVEISNAKDTIHEPRRYSLFQNFDVIDLVEDIKAGFRIGNAIKYLVRSCYRCVVERSSITFTTDERTDYIKDLCKAREYILRELVTKAKEWREEGALTKEQMGLIYTSVLGENKSNNDVFELMDKINKEDRDGKTDGNKD